MKNGLRLLSIALVLCMALSLAACGKADTAAISTSQSGQEAGSALAASEASAESEPAGEVIHRGDGSIIGIKEIELNGETYRVTDDVEVQSYEGEEYLTSPTMAVTINGVSYEVGAGDGSLWRTEAEKEKLFGDAGLDPKDYLSKWGELAGYAAECAYIYDDGTVIVNDGYENPKKIEEIMAEAKELQEKFPQSGISEIAAIDSYAYRILQNAYCFTPANEKPFTYADPFWAIEDSEYFTSTGELYAGHCSDVIHIMNPRYAWYDDDSHNVICSEVDGTTQRIERILWSSLGGYQSSVSGQASVLKTLSDNRIAELGIADSITKDSGAVAGKYEAYRIVNYTKDGENKRLIFALKATMYGTDYSPPYKDGCAYLMEIDYTPDKETIASSICRDAALANGQYIQRGSDAHNAEVFNASEAF